MRFRTLFLTALSTTLVTSLALPVQHKGRDSVRITNQTPAFDSANDDSAVNKRQGAPPEGTFDWTSDSSETFRSNCKGDCLSATWQGNAQQGKRGEIGGGSVEEDQYNLDGTSSENGSAWDN
jgi:hypothetical protein